MSTKPTTVAKYLAALPKDRRDALQAIREVILANLDDGYEEGIQYGMPAYFVPHRVYPAGYHCDPKQPLPYASIASQKSHMAIYLFCVYTSEAEQRWLREAWMKTGKKLDMGKSCIRFKKIEDVPLDVIGKAIKRTPAKKFIKHYEASLAGAGRPATKKTSTKKKTTKKVATKVAKKVATKVAKKVATKVAKKSAKKATKKASARSRAR